MERRLSVLTVPLPSSRVCVVLVVSPGLSVFGLVFKPEMASAAFFTIYRIDAHEFGEFEKVSDSSGSLE
jgi:hypothetical protein